MQLNCYKLEASYRSDASFSATFLGLSRFSGNLKKTMKTLFYSAFQKKNDTALPATAIAGARGKDM